jgi:hypothetical protein
MTLPLTLETGNLWMNLSLELVKFVFVLILGAILVLDHRPDAIPGNT